MIELTDSQIQDLFKDFPFFYTHLSKVICKKSKRPSDAFFSLTKKRWVNKQEISQKTRDKINKELSTIYAYLTPK